MEDLLQTKKLGFGLMRLPRKGIGIDVEQVKQMVDLFMDAGFTYFDTAFVYPGSEEAIRKALVERYPRESYTLATKLYAAMVPTEKAAKEGLRLHPLPPVRKRVSAAFENNRSSCEMRRGA